MKKGFRHILVCVWEPLAVIYGDLAAAFISRMFVDGAESLDMDGQQG